MKEELTEKELVFLRTGSLFLSGTSLDICFLGNTKSFPEGEWLLGLLFIIPEWASILF